MTSGNEGEGMPNRRLVDRPGRDPSREEVLAALRHPLRRRILRALHSAGEARSPRELSRGFQLPVSNVSYHVRFLREKNAVALTDRRPVRGSIEHFYVSVVPANRFAAELLAATADDDG